MNNISFKSKLEGITEISVRNKAFNTLSDEDKRKEIAFDALTLLLQEKVVAQAGIYWDNKLRQIKNNTNTPEELQKSLCGLSTSKESEYCGVCARGALMLSTIRLGNELSPDGHNIDCGSPTNIKGFNYNDFMEMEAEFEGTNSEEEDEYDEPIPYYNIPYESGSNEKLACILGNVIINGNYTPSDNTDYVELWYLKV